ncbi:MAG: hypothetical protein JXP34_12175 [Planctomycetes bacterium]|nr:hypothetical protein [Planctomycetota bacterium]
MADCAVAEADAVTTTSFTPTEAGIESDEIHERALASFTCEQQARYAHIFYLRLVETRGVYMLKGYSSMVHYGEANFGYSERKTRDLLRVGDALERFPKIAGAFEAGAIDYSKVREITKVAGTETEEAWLDLARKLNTHEVEREVAAAKKGGRKRKLGTPAAWVPHAFRVLPLQANVIGKALKKLSDLVGEDVDLARGFLMMAAHILEEDGDGDPKALPNPLYRARA